MLLKICPVGIDRYFIILPMIFHFSPITNLLMFRAIKIPVFFRCWSPVPPLTWSICLPSSHLTHPLNEANQKPKYAAHGISNDSNWCHQGRSKDQCSGVGHQYPLSLDLFACPPPIWLRGPVAVLRVGQRQDFAVYWCGIWEWGDVCWSCGQVRQPLTFKEIMTGKMR